MADHKFITGYQQAARQLVADVGSASFRCYDIDSLPAGIISEKYLEKCIQVIVAVSGSHPHSGDWIFVCPYRVDGGRANAGAKVHDIDPAVLFLSHDTGVPQPTGVILYHRNYLRNDPTLEVSGYDCCDLETTVSDLRAQLITGLGSLTDAPQPILNVLTEMVNDFKGYLPI